MSTLNLQVLRCLSRLKSEEFLPLLEWLRTQEDEAFRAAARSEGSHAGRLQGKALFLEEFLEKVDKSDDLLRKPGR